MPSAKRRLQQLERDNSKVAKTIKSIASFFGSNSANQVEPVVQISTTENTQDVESRRKQSGHSSRFNQQWASNRPWLYCVTEISPDGQSYEAMYCRLCQKHQLSGNSGSLVWNRVGCVSLRLERVTSHEQSPMHKEGLSLEIQTDNKLQDVVNKMETKEFAALVDAQKVLHFLIQHNLPHTTLFKPLVELCIELGATNLPNLQKGGNASYTSHRTVTEFLECQAEVVEETVTSKLRDSPYGLMLDEYTDISTRKHLALVGKYLDAGKPHLAFLQDIQLPNGTADVIYTSMKQYLRDSQIPLKNMSSFASDGPSVMLGKKNGVVAQLQRDNGQVIPVHCMNHRLQLAVSKAFHDVRQIENVDETLDSIFKYYHYSAVKSASLQSMQTLLRDIGETDSVRNLSVKRAVHTRWLSHENAVQTVRKLYIPICRDLENAVAEGRDKKLGDKTGLPSGSLLKNMKQYDKIFFIHLLCDVCSMLASLTRLFEKETVDLAIVQPKLQATVINLEKLKVKEGPYSTKASSICEELEVPLVPEKIAKSRDDFIDKLVENLQHRLESSEMLTNFSELNLSVIPVDQTLFHGDQAISAIADHLGLDVDETLVEWNDLKEVFRENLEQCTPAYLLQTLEKKSDSFGSIYKNMKQILSVHETLILSTAPVERVFSKVKLVVTDHRNRLTVDTTNKLLMVALNSRTINDIDLNKVVKLYLEKKNRRIL